MQIPDPEVGRLQHPLMLRQMESEKLPGPFPHFLLCQNYPWTNLMGTSWAPLRNKCSDHSPQVPPADAAAETRAVHTELVRAHTLHGVHRLQAGGTHFFQNGLRKERLRLNN